MIPVDRAIAHLRDRAAGICRYDKRAFLAGAEAIGHPKTYEAFWTDLANFVDALWENEVLRNHFVNRIQMAKDATKHPQFSRRLAEFRNTFHNTVREIRRRINAQPQDMRVLFFRPNAFATQLLAPFDYRNGKQHSCDFFLCRLQRGVAQEFSVRTAARYIRGLAFCMARLYTDRITFADLGQHYAGQLNNLLEAMEHLHPGITNRIEKPSLFDQTTHFYHWLNGVMLRGSHCYLDLVSVYARYAGGMLRHANEMIGQAPLCPPPWCRWANELVPRDDEHVAAFDTARQAVNGVCEDLSEHSLPEFVGSQDDDALDDKSLAGGVQRKGAGEDDPGWQTNHGLSLPNGLDMEGHYDAKQLAEKFGVSYGALRRRLERARKRPESVVECVKVKQGQKRELYKYRLRTVISLISGCPNIRHRGHESGTDVTR